MNEYYKKNHKKQHTILEKIERLLQNTTLFQNITFTREIQLLIFFCFLFLIIILRLFYLQVIKHGDYETQLNIQHTRSTSVKADRGDIYATDKTGQPVKLTENISLYDISIDPSMIGNTGGISMKPRLIEVITPTIYKHLCEINGMNQVNPEDCIKNVETFAGVTILPKQPEFFYYGSGIVSDNYYSFDFTGFNDRKTQVISGFSQQQAYDLIKQKLDQKIQIGIKPQNFLGFIEDEEFLADIATGEYPFIEVAGKNYVYVVPNKIGYSKSRAKSQLASLLEKHHLSVPSQTFNSLFEPQEYKYIKLISAASPIIAQDFKKIKDLYYNEKSATNYQGDKRGGNVPLLHGIALEPYTLRYYPYGSFMSHLLGYVDKNGDPYFGVEKYFNDTLKGTDGQIKGRASSWIGTVGANDFEVINAKDGDDVYLTIDIGIQKEAESIAKKYLQDFKADSISILVYDPQNGQVKASVNAPDFNPNNYNDAYFFKPLGPEEGYLLDSITYIDIPVYISTGGTYKQASSSERFDPTVPKYIATNIYGPQVFMDKNISSPFEPGSVFKAFTVGIGLDTDEIQLYNMYQDDGEVKVGPYTIKNADTKCLGNNTFLRGFVFSCNIGMVRIIQKIGKETYYNYLEKLGFGEQTKIELAEEKPGFVDNPTTVSLARFLNNSFGQGVQTTQIQLAAAYGSLVNGGYYIKPTIMSAIMKKDANGEPERIENKAQILRQIFRPEVSDEIREALYQVMEGNASIGNNARIPGYSLGGKSGTSQLSYKGKYQRGDGWTNGTFIGVVTKDNPQYIVLVRISRPRSNQWGGNTAGKIFKDMTKFLIGYSMIEADKEIK